LVNVNRVGVLLKSEVCDVNEDGVGDGTTTVKIGCVPVKVDNKDVDLLRSEVSDVTASVMDGFLSKSKE
jgi:hypothetical protein